MRRLTSPWSLPVLVLLACNGGTATDTTDASSSSSTGTSTGGACIPDARNDCQPDSSSGDVPTTTPTTTQGPTSATGTDTTDTATTGPVSATETVFDRISVEIARGCTEGCRFCQAGMIYRPVRERSPESVVDTIVRAVKEGGYDEASLTSLSTADYSCIAPLVKRVMEKLKLSSNSDLTYYALKNGLMQ